MCLKHKDRIDLPLAMATLLYAELRHQLSASEGKRTLMRKCQAQVMSMKSYFMRPTRSSFPSHHPENKKDMALLEDSLIPAKYDLKARREPGMYLSAPLNNAAISH